MRRRRLSVLIASTVLATAIVSPASALPASSQVREWNQNAVTAIMGPGSGATPGAAYPPQAGVILIAMVQGAVYDAVNAIVGTHQPYLSGLDAAPATASTAAAAATAAHDVLMGLTPLLPVATRDWVAEKYADQIAEIAEIESPANVAAGVAAGANAAARMLATRAGDGRFASFSFDPNGTEPGEWQSAVSDPFAWVANVRPFTLASPSQLRTDGPPALDSAAYANDYNEVKSLGSASSTTRTADQTALALFYTVNPVEMFNRTFRTVTADRGLSIAEEARLFAMINLAGADGLISCWDDKAHWSFWRPDTAIRNGDADGNAATVGDPTWTPLRPNPPYPEHPSGYNCLTSSVMNTAVEFFGTKKLSFTVVQSTAAGSPWRAYDSLTDVVKDTIDSRMYLGIHFRTGDVAGAVIGRKVAHWLDRHYFGPAG